MTKEQEADRDPKTGRFLPGNIGGGRPKGSRNKLGEAFVSDMFAAWQEKGPAVIEEVIENDPTAFLKVVAGILPKEIHHKDAEDDLTEAEYDAALDIIAGLIADRKSGGTATPTHGGQGSA